MGKSRVCPLLLARLVTIAHPSFSRGNYNAGEQFEALQVTLGQSGTGTICFGQIYDEQSAVLAIEEEIARLQGDNQ